MSKYLVTYVYERKSYLNGQSYSKQEIHSGVYTSKSFTKEEFYKIRKVIAELRHVDEFSIDIINWKKFDEEDEE